MTDLEIKNLIEKIDVEKSPANLRKLLIDYHPYDLATIFKELSEQSRKLFYSTFDEKELADIFEYLDEEDAVKYLQEMNLQKASSVINEMEPDDAADVMSAMEDDNMQSYLAEMPKEDAQELGELVKYDDDTAGSVMSTNYVELSTKMDVKDAMKHLISVANELEIIDPLFICENDILKGYIDLKDLIIARSPNKMEDIMNPNVISCEVNDDIGMVIKKIKDYDINAIPVTDNGKLVGIVTVDDAIDEAIEDIKDDYSKMVGVTSDIDETTNIFKNMLKRLPWLICLLVASLLISNITSTFEEVIVQVTIFAFFQSLVFDMAGNAGTQSLAVTVRSISKHEMDTKKGVFKHLGKELLTAVITSVILGILTFGMCYLYLLIKNDKTVVYWLVSLIISGSLMISLLVTEMLGAIIPLFFYKIKVDPAVASGPLITTLSDTISIVIYFGLASLLLSHIMVGG